MQNITERIQIFEHTAMGNLMVDILYYKISQENTEIFG